MAPTSEIRRVSDADGAVVLDLRRGTMFRLNPLGSKILDLLELGTPLRGIAEQISTESGAPLGVVEADVASFVERLRFHGILDSRSTKV